MTHISEAPARTRAQIGERTLRKDPWWQRSIVVATLLTVWVAYATVRVFTGHWYFASGYNYLTPFYSPCVNGECVPGSSTLGHWIPAIPPIIPYAFVSLPFVLGFRLSQSLLAAGYPHSVLPLSGVTHMTPQETVAENLLLLQVAFLRDALARPVV